jgi:hypothetical protein
MAFGARASCRAEVVLTGFDVDDITRADPVAAVTIKAPEDAQSLARFIGMSVVAMLRDATHTPAITGPFARTGLRVADALAEPTRSADLSSFSIARLVRPVDPVPLLSEEGAWMNLTGQDPSWDTIFTVKFPRVGSDPQPGKRRRLRVKLHERKAPFVALRSRNAMIAADGVLCMFEQVARERPGEVTRHVAAVCKRIFEMHRDTTGEDTAPSFGDATALYRVAEMIAVADDPSAFGREASQQDRDADDAG